MHVYTGEIIDTVLADDNKVKEWKANLCHENILGGLASLICVVADHDEALATQLMLQVLRKFIQPLSEKIEWIKTEQEKLGQPIKEEQINEYILNSTVDHLELIGALIKESQGLIREPGSN